LLFQNSSKNTAKNKKNVTVKVRRYLFAIAVFKKARKNGLKKLNF